MKITPLAVFLAACIAVMSVPLGLILWDRIGPLDAPPGKLGELANRCVGAGGFWKVENSPRRHSVVFRCYPKAWEAEVAP